MQVIVSFPAPDFKKSHSMSGFFLCLRFSQKRETSR